MSKETGGPAFPTQINNSGNAVIKGFNGEEIKAHTFSAYPGMNLRDYFAAKALQGLISTSGAPCLLGMGGCENDTASTAYKLADAMLAARVKP